MRRAPAHAGRLRPWERLAFALVFTLMAVLVVGVTLSATRSPDHALATRSPASARTPAADPGITGTPSDQPVSSTQSGQAGKAGQQGGTDADGATVSAKLDARLAAALRPVLSRDTGQLAVGVIDNRTGAEALYHGGRHFHTASIIKADILATLLYQHQKTATLLNDDQADLAASMIEDSDDQAATDLWNEVGGAPGIAAANTVLQLRHTIAGTDDYWGLTRTTAVDQLQLLTDLTSPASPLDSAGRDYELGLMENVESGQRWGVSAAASAGSTTAIKNGWLPDPTLWVINSIGIVEHDGQELLIAVLSDHNPTEADGISAVQAAAKAAAAVMTSPQS